MNASSTRHLRKTLNRSFNILTGHHHQVSHLVDYDDDIRHGFEIELFCFVDCLTGIAIKANFPTRISFQVTSKIDSRVMLGEAGAEQLLGMGDMLYMAGGGRITRVHGPFVDDQEVEDIVNHLKTQGVPQYLEAITEEEEPEEDAAGGSAAGDLANSDDPYDQAVAIVLRDRKASTSYIQRRLSVGYNKAASLIERMEQEGLISPANHAGKREILVPAEDEVL